MRGLRAGKKPPTVPTHMSNYLAKRVLRCSFWENMSVNPRVGFQVERCVVVGKLSNHWRTGGLAACCGIYISERILDDLASIQQPSLARRRG